MQKQQLLQRGQGKLVQRVIARLVLSAKCLTPIRNYHTRQSEVEYQLAFSNNLHIASFKQLQVTLSDFDNTRDVPSISSQRFP